MVIKIDMARASRLVFALMVAAVMLVSSAAMAAESEFKYPGMSLTHCTVTSDQWLYASSRPYLTLPIAIESANAGGDSTLNACREEIALAVDQIFMKHPLEIRYYGSSEKPFVIKGGCKADDDKDGKCDEFVEGKKTVLDAKNIPDTYSCVIDITTEAHDVHIENIEIINARGKTGVCINGYQNKVDSLIVNGAKNGIVVGEGATSNAIGTKIALKNLEEKAITFNNPAATANNIMIPNAFELGSANDYGYVDLFSEDTMVITGTNSSDWVYSANGYQVRLTAKDPHYGDGGNKKPTHIDIEGYVIDSTDRNWDSCPTTVAAGLNSIMIFSVGGKGTVPSQITSAEGDDEDSEEGSESPAAEQLGLSDGRLVGVIGQGSGFGLDSDTGTFYVRLPVEYSRVVFLPETTGGGVGSVSSIITLDPAKSEVTCADVEIEGNPFGNNNNPGGVAGNKMMGQQHCCSLRNIKAQYCGMVYYANDPSKPIEGKPLRNQYWDTDGDGLIDDEEDKNLNCVPDSGETSYFNADSDNDGIPDGTKFEKEESNGVLNALNRDVDGDGLLDGEEDRNQNINFGVENFPARNYLYNISVNASFSIANAVKDENDNPVRCDLKPQGSELALGVGYDLWTVYCSDPACSRILSTNKSQGTDWSSFSVAANEVPLTDSQGRAYTKRIHAFACRNVSVGSKDNFNGEWEPGNYELNPGKPDTDDDTANDKEDPCPLFFGTTAEECKGEERCNQNRLKDVLYGIDPDYVEFDNSTGAPSGYKMKGSVPLFITEIMNYSGDKRARLLDICQGDMDGDGVKDCVEQPQTNTCPAGDQLKFWESDSDGDNIEDLMDVCPESRGSGLEDEFADGKDIKSDYSCDAYNGLYSQGDNMTKKIRAFIWDRDQDGLYDYEEDLNLDGKGFDESLSSKFSADGKLVNMTYEDVNSMETNPMLADTDGDGITDFNEKRYPVRDEYYTNPRNPDTDGDGLLDGQEDRDGDGLFTNVTTLVIGSEGCVGAMKLDTDPTNPDTDGDGLTDYQEVSGDIFVGQLFINAIMDDNVWDTIGKIAVGSNPRSVDSDGDGIPDAEEYNGSFVDWFSTNPCMWDSDNDGVNDIDEFEGCGLNPDTNCKATTVLNRGRDSDNDGLTDSCEKILGTDPNLADSDNDGIWDGAEVNFQMVLEEYKLSKDLRVFKDGSTLKAHFDCTYDPDAGDINPDMPDTDGDGVSDGNEVAYGSDPRQWDTDGDCIPDGPMMIRNHLGEEIYSLGENKNADHKRDSNETDATLMDTDGDGLPDGFFNGLGEDFNCNGQRDRNERGEWLETDPLNIDSDLDGIPDGEEIGGNMANLSRAVTRNEGCSLSGSASGSPSSMFYLFGMMMLAVKAAARRIRKTPA